MSGQDSDFFSKPVVIKSLVFLLVATEAMSSFALTEQSNIMVKNTPKGYFEFTSFLPFSSEKYPD